MSRSSIGVLQLWRGYVGLEIRFRGDTGSGMVLGQRLTHCGDVPMRGQDAVGVLSQALQWCNGDALAQHMACSGSSSISSGPALAGSRQR